MELSIKLKNSGHLQNKLPVGKAYAICYANDINCFLRRLVWSLKNLRLVRFGFAFLSQSAQKNRFNLVALTIRHIISLFKLIHLVEL